MRSFPRRGKSPWDEPEFSMFKREGTGPVWMEHGRVRGRRRGGVKGLAGVGSCGGHVGSCHAMLHAMRNLRKF